MEVKMTAKHKEKIRQAVRESYGKVAGRGTSSSEKSLETPCCGPDISAGKSPVTSCCGPGVSAEKRSETSCCGPDISVQESPAASCCGPGVSVEQISATLGYSKEDVESVPKGANMGLGCGNPVALASLKPGEVVVDLGCGGGFDCFLASKEVGETGQVIGVDMTPEMVGKARENLEKVAASNVEFRLGEIEHLPVADNSADIIMSNCVINLSPDKEKVYMDAFRVLKPGGRLAISDIVATAPIPEEVRQNMALVAACIGGAETIDNTVNILNKVGFHNIKITPKDESRELIQQWAVDSNAGDYIVSACIEAVKPR